MKFRSTLFDQGSGSLSNMVILKSNVIRARVIPANPNTTAQQTVRARLATIAGAWVNTLTDAQRDAWRAYALTVTKTNSIGQTVSISGLDAYVRTNTVMLQGGSTRLDTAPTASGSLVVPQITGLDIDATGAVTITYATALPATIKVNASTSATNISPGRNSFTGPYRYRVTGTGAASVTLIVDTGETPTAGSTVAVRLIHFNTTGQVSEPFSQLLTVSA